MCAKCGRRQSAHLAVAIVALAAGIRPERALDMTVREFADAVRAVYASRLS